MKFKKLKIKNIRSYKSQEIVFPEGSLLLAGDVGCGKTSLLMAIEYALFGLQPGQKGNALLRNNESLGEVTLELDLSGREVIIERKLKRTLKGISNEFASITIDGNRTESSVTEVKSKIISLLGYPPEFVKRNNVLYRYTVHTAQEQMKQIILEDPETRVNLLRHIFGVDKYKIIKENLSILSSNLKSQAKIIQGEILELERNKEELIALGNTLQNLETTLQGKRLELEAKQKIKSQKESEVNALEEKIKEKNLLGQEIEKIKIMLSTKREMLINTSRDEEELNKIVEGFSEEFNEAKHLETTSLLQTRKEYLDKLNSASITLLARKESLEKQGQETLGKKERIFKIDICPTCLQNVSENHKHNILNETENSLVDIKKQLSFTTEEQLQVSESLASVKKEISAFEEALFRMEVIKSRQQQAERAKQKLLEVIKQKEMLLKDQEFLTQHINNLKEKILVYSPLEISYRKKEEELKQALFDEKNAEISLAESEKERQLLQKEQFQMAEKIQRKEKSRAQLYRINDLVDWLSTQFLKYLEIAERNVLIKLRKEFSSLFRKWFMVLISDNSLDAEVDESFTPVIIQNETEMDYSYLSGGERTAVALAYRLALNQTINSVLSKIKTKGVIILDEPTEGFSEAQISKIRDILEELNAEQLIIVSHEQKIDSFVDNVIHITKEGDVSTIEEALTQKSEPYQKT